MACAIRIFSYSLTELYSDCAVVQYHHIVKNVFAHRSFIKMVEFVLLTPEMDPRHDVGTLSVGHNIYYRTLAFVLR